MCFFVLVITDHRKHMKFVLVIGFFSQSIIVSNWIHLVTKEVFHSFLCLTIFSSMYVNMYSIYVSLCFEIKASKNCYNFPDIYICIYVYIDTCAYIYVYIFFYIYIHIYEYANIYGFVYTVISWWASLSWFHDSISWLLWIKLL